VYRDATDCYSVAGSNRQLIHSGMAGCGFSAGPACFWICAVWCSCDFRRGFLLDCRVKPYDNGASLSTIGRDTEGDAVAFTTTHWSVVLTAQGESPAAHEALERLCRIYWRPIYSFVRRQGFGREEAEDITQGLFAQLLE